MENKDAKDVLDELIRQSAAEDLSAIDPDTNSISTRSRLLVNHSWTLLSSWLLCACVLTFLYLEPLPKQHDLGTRSVETRISVAMYHIAYHVETYRNQTGRLPDYLENSWQASQEVQYLVKPDGYELIGRSGQFERTYKEGMDPERLLLSRSKRQDPR